MTRSWYLYNPGQRVIIWLLTRLALQFDPVQPINQRRLTPVTVGAISATESIITSRRGLDQNTRLDSTPAQSQEVIYNHNATPLFRNNPEVQPHRWKMQQRAKEVIFSRWVTAGGGWSPGILHAPPVGGLNQCLSPSRPATAAPFGSTLPAKTLQLLLQTQCRRI